MNYGQPQQPITYLATGHSAQTQSEYHQLYWMVGAALIGFGLLSVGHAAITRSLDLSLFWHCVKLIFMFALPGAILFRTRGGEVSWDDYQISYRSLTGKKTSARFDQIKDWGDFNLAAGKWVKFENSPVLFFTLMMTNCKDLENRIGREMARYYPDKLDGNDSVVSPDLFLIGGLALLAAVLYFINGG